MPSSTKRDNLSLGTCKFGKLIKYSYLLIQLASNEKSDITDSFKHHICTFIKFFDYGISEIFGCKGVTFSLIFQGF